MSLTLQREFEYRDPKTGNWKRYPIGLGNHLGGGYTFWDELGGRKVSTLPEWLKVSRETAESFGDRLGESPTVGPGVFGLGAFRGVHSESGLIHSYVVCVFGIMEFELDLPVTELRAVIWGWG
jgi:hypothetical protein